MRQTSKADKDRQCPLLDNRTPKGDCSILYGLTKNTESVSSSFRFISMPVLGKIVKPAYSIDSRC
jgi:hypothetical protein